MNPSPTVPTSSPSTIVGDVEQVIADILGQVNKAGLTGVVTEIESLFAVVMPFVPGLAAIGREGQRETLLKGMLENNDLPGLEAYDADEPPHPNGSRAICRGFEVIVKANIAAGATPGQPSAAS